MQKFLIFGLTVLVLLMTISISIFPAYSQSSRIHEIDVSEQVFSMNVPVVGNLRINMEYVVDFEIRKPSSIEAGNSGIISITPRTGTLYTSVYLDNSHITTLNTPINLGDRKSIPLTGVLGVDIHVVATPTAKIQSKILGPATISTQIVNVDSVRPMDFKINVRESIGNSDRVQVTFPVTLYIAATGGVSLVIQDLDLDPVLIPFATKTITEAIPIYKNYNTYLSLQVSEGSKTGSIKVFPKLTYGNGNSFSEYVSIYVDGTHKSNVKSNQWSGNLNVGSGSHNIQAKFSELRSSENHAITFLESQSNVQQITVKSPPSSSPSPNKQSSSSMELTCGTGTYEKNGECVATGPFDGIIWFFEDLFRQFNFFTNSPTLDLDNDGIDDTQDMCNTKPETYNGYKDTDGCPD